MNSNGQPISKSAISFGLALALASLANAALVVAKEKSPATMSALRRLTGNHLVSHALIVLVLFIAFGLLFRMVRGISVHRVIASIIGGVVLSGLIIAGFYLIGG